MSITLGRMISIQIHFLFFKEKGHYNIENTCHDEECSQQPNNGHQSGKGIENDQHTE